MNRNRLYASLRAVARVWVIFASSNLLLAGLSVQAAAQCPALPCGAGACTITTNTTIPAGAMPCTLLNFPNADITVASGVTISAPIGHTFTINAKSLTLAGKIDAPRGTVNIRVKTAFTTNTSFDPQPERISVRSASTGPLGKVSIERLLASDNPTVTLNGSIDATGGGSANTHGGTIDIRNVSTITVNTSLLAPSGTAGNGGFVTLRATGNIAVNAGGSANVSGRGTPPANGQAGKIKISAGGDVTLAGTLDATTGAGAGSIGGDVEVIAGVNRSLSVSGTINVTAFSTGAEDGQIIIGPACNVSVSGVLDAHLGTHTNGRVTMIYRGTLDASTATADAEPIAGANTIRCRCANPTSGGTCGASPTCATAPSTGATIVPPAVIQPVAIPACQSEAVLLIDTSGSMAWKPDGTTTTILAEQRITLAKNSALEFVDLLDGFSLGTANIGVARFPKQPYTGCFGENKMPLQTLNSGTPTGKAKAEATINELTPLEWTPMLDGIGVALGMFTTGSNASRAIVLLSDGYHNCPSEVAATDTQVTTKTTAANTANIDIHTIGFGAPADTPLTFLDDLAATTGGEFKDVTADTGFNPATFDPATALHETFTNVLVNSFGLDASVDPLDTIAGGTSKTHQVSVNSYDESVAVVVGWRTPGRRRLMLEVTASDGHVISTHDASVRWIERDTYKILIASPAFLQQPGKVSNTPWTVRVDASNVPAADDEHYHYGLVANSTLNMRTGVGPASVRTGTVMTMTARLTESDVPVTGSPTVTVTVTRPDDGLGNWLFAHPVRVTSPPVLQGQEKASGTALRAAAIMASGVALPGRTTPAKTPLFDDGTHGDVTANDGIYTNQFTDTQKEGTYAFFFEASGTDDSGVHFERQDTVHRRVELALDTKSSIIQTTKTAIPNQYLITVEPRDRFGNHFGPDRAPGLILVASAGKMVGPLKDTGDGRYTQVLELSDDDDIEDIEIEVRQPGAAASQPIEPKHKCKFWCWLKGIFGHKC